MLFKGYYESPIGNILITADNDVIHQISFIENIPDNIENDPINSLVDETRKQLSLYFSQKRQKFDLPVFTGQSDFAKEVFEEVRNIPFGQTITYSQLAMRLGSTRLTRAVASANAKIQLYLLFHVTEWWGRITNLQVIRENCGESNGF